MALKSGYKHLLGAGILGDNLGAAGHSVLGQLPGQQQSYGHLDFSGSDGRALVVTRQARRFSHSRDALQDVIDERVHDAHGLAPDAGVRVALIQHLVQVHGVALLTATLALLPISFLGHGHRLLAALLRDQRLH